MFRCRRWCSKSRPLQTTSRRWPPTRGITRSAALPAREDDDGAATVRSPDRGGRLGTDRRDTVPSGRLPALRRAAHPVCQSAGRATRDRMARSELADDPDFDFYCLVDSTAAVDALEAGLQFSRESGQCPDRGRLSGRAMRSSPARQRASARRRGRAITTPNTHGHRVLRRSDIAHRNRRDASGSRRVSLLHPRCRARSGHSHQPP